MRIVIDMQSSQSGSRLGGIGRYSTELAKAMARNARGHEVWLVMNNLLPASIADVRCTFADLIPQDRINVFDVHSGIAEHGNNKTKVRAAELIRESFISGLKPDIVHVSSLFEGLHEEVVTSVGAIFPAERTAVTLYDLIPYVQQKEYLTDQESLQYYLGKINNLKRAGRLLSISEFSRREAIELLGLNPTQVINISSAADERFRPTPVAPDDAARLRNKYRISKKYLMYTGSFDQRKNHANLIRAFGLVPRKTRSEYQLLIVGNGWDAIYQQLRGIARTAGLSEDDIVFTGRVAEEDLLPLYNLCDLFVFPSLAEGFGLPALEAMSCGIPTIGSNCTSLPEVIGWPEAQFDPLKPQSIAKTITRVLSDKDFRETLRARGFEQSKSFSWDESARKAIDSFEDSVRNVSTASLPRERSKSVVPKLANLEGIESLPDGALKEMSRCIALNRSQIAVLDSVAGGERSNLRIGWVSTWNTRCGIAAYSKFIIEHMPADVTIFAPETDWTIAADGKNVKRCWQVGNKGGLANLHRELIAANIEVLIIQFNYGFFDFESFNTLLHSLIIDGIRVLVTFHSTNDPSDDKRLSSISALSGCDGLLVHSHADVQKIRALNCQHNLVFLPQGIVGIAPASTKYPNGERRNNGERRFVIATYGFALPGKGLEQVVEAVSILAKENKNINLLMVNSEYPVHQSADLIEDIRVRALRMSISDRVTIISDYLPDDVSLGYLTQADLIVYAYQNTGESSSAAVRMGLASGVPVAVTPIAIFDDVKSSVFRLPGFTPAEIAAGIKRVLDMLQSADEYALQVQSNARTLRDAHGFPSIAQYLFAMAIKPKSERIEYKSPRDFGMTQKSDSLFFNGDALQLRSNVGLLTAGSMRTTNRAGFLLYGPFISVAPGRYCALVRGKVGDQGVGDANAQIAIECGAQVLTECKIGQANEEDLLAKLAFIVPDGGCEGLEVRVEVDEYSDLSVSSIELVPVSIL
jgi:glycosyltransferase involved in cell wall biosynthesis